MAGLAGFMLRFVLLFMLFAALSLSALAFEAAQKTQITIELVRTSRAVDSQVVRTQVLNEAARTIETSWARPAAWHAGAAEALSAAYAAQADANGGDRALYTKSMLAASRAVALAPVQPQTWTRLAVFADMGLPGAPCSVATCLDMSWRSAKMTDPQTACIRLRIAHAHGLLQGPDDERVIWYVRSGVGAQDVAQCLNFLPRDALFRLLANLR